MPIYEFECSDCGEVFETIVSSTDKIDQVTCKKCRSRNIKKNISAGSYRVGGGTSSPGLPTTGGCNRSGFT